MRFLVINGPNLNLLGTREPEFYGSASYADLCSRLEKFAERLDCSIKFFQSNHEGEICDRLQKAPGDSDAVVLNPGAFAHYSYAVRDTVSAINLPVVEVHISNVYKREPFRHVSVLAPVCAAHISGLGFSGYEAAMSYLLENY